MGDAIRQVQVSHYFISVAWAEIRVGKQNQLFIGESWSRSEIPLIIIDYRFSFSMCEKKITKCFF